MTLTNTGDGPLDITSIAASPRFPFAQTNNCASTVNPGASCILNVTFIPTGQGMLYGEDRPHRRRSGSPPTVILTGTGIVGTNFNPNFTTLVQGLDGNLYGTAFQGGTFSQGTVFKVTPTETVTHDLQFRLQYGAAPYAGLVLGTDGNFYGTT